MRGGEGEKREEGGREEEVQCVYVTQARSIVNGIGGAKVFKELYYMYYINLFTSWY